MWKKEASIKNRLNMLLVICLVPLTVLILYLVVIMQQFSGRYDEVVENITKANAYNIDFKDDLDYQMYIIVANSERADELIDTAEPRRMIEEAREVFQGLYESADAEYGKQRLNRILKSLNILEDRVIEIETDAKVSGFYDKNMERLDLDIRVLTELIQEQIQEYIYYETTNLEVLREGIRSDVDRTLRMTSIIFLLILVSAFLISQKLMQGIMVPIGRLCEVTRKAAGGDFTVRAKEDNSAELSVLNSSFNSMIEKIGNLVEDIRVEQLNLRATELKLLQAQINPHFLYNTLDTIIWLAEAGKKDDVVMMVTTLSDFFRTTLSKGRDYISVREEEAHIRSYLQIQQFRYRDILEYSIDIPEELYEASILDGASHFQYFGKVVLPLSKTIIAVLAVYYGIGKWNDYFTGLVYFKDRSKYPLQTILREILASLQTNMSGDFMIAMSENMEAYEEALNIAYVSKYCIIVVATVPVVILYLFVQKYFEKGVMIGSLKG